MSRFIKHSSIFKTVREAVIEFFREGGVDRVSLLSYYSILSVLFLLTFFLYIFSHILSDPQRTLSNIYPFSADFFSKISPELIGKAGQLSEKIENIGVIGIVVSLFLSFIVIQKSVQYINEFFGINIRKKKRDRTFFIRRFSEFSLLFLFAVVGLLSFFLSGIISALTRFFKHSEFLRQNIDPSFIDGINHFLIKTAAPVLISFVMFFIIFKWIPEKKVYTRGALISAVLATIFWEVSKRAYTFYLTRVSLLSKLEGSFIAIILFAFWMELSFSILLIGVKTTSLFDRQEDHAGNHTQEDH